MAKRGARGLVLAFAWLAPLGPSARAAAQSGPNPTYPVALSAQDRDALGRVAYAEAGNQREEGLAAVIYAVLNRVASGRFGSGVQGVLDAPGQFEPVARAGGRWRDLPPLTATQRVVFGTILDLILQGRLPDPTHGATYFQNPAIVARRAASGIVSPGLVDFGGQTPVAVVRDHSFFHHAGPAMGRVSARPAPPSRSEDDGGAFYRIVQGRLVRQRSGISPADAGPVIIRGRPPS